MGMTGVGVTHPWYASMQDMDAFVKWSSREGEYNLTYSTHLILYMSPNQGARAEPVAFFTKNKATCNTFVSRANKYTIVEVKGLNTNEKKHKAKVYIQSLGMDIALNFDYGLWTVAKTDLAKFSKAMRDFKAEAREKKKDADWAPNQALGHLSALFRTYDLRRNSVGGWAFRDLPFPIDINPGHLPHGTKQMERHDLFVWVGGRRVTRLGEWDAKTGEVFPSEPKVKFLLAWLEATVNLFE